MIINWLMAGVVLVLFLILFWQSTCATKKTKPERRNIGGIFLDFSDFLDATLSVGNDLVKPRAAQQSDIMRNCLHLKTFENISSVRYHVFWYLNIHNVHFQKHNFGKNICKKNCQVWR